MKDRATDEPRARKLREAGLGYKEIAKRLGYGVSTIYRWLNPDAEERARQASLAWKDANRETNRARDRARADAPESRGRCMNPCCSNLRGKSANLKRPGGSRPRVANGRTYSRGYCQECAAAIAAARRSIGEGMWAAGWPIKDWRAIIGQCVGVARERGWDLPHRYNVKSRVAA